MFESQIIGYSSEGRGAATEIYTMKVVSASVLGGFVFGHKWVHVQIYNQITDCCYVASISTCEHRRLILVGLDDHLNKFDYTLVG